jgi:hypothetical protein
MRIALMLQLTANLKNSIPIQKVTETLYLLLRIDHHFLDRLAEHPLAVTDDIFCIFLLLSHFD